MSMDNLRAPGPIRPACSRHPGFPAVAQCVLCGRYLCSTCRVLVNNRNSCASCAAAAHGYPYPAAAPVPRRRTREVVFPDAPWGIGEAFIIFGVSILIASVLSAILFSFLAEVTDTVTALFLFIFFSSSFLCSLLLGGTYYSVSVRHGSNYAALGLKLDGMGKGVALGLGVGLPLFVGALLLASFSSYLLDPIETDYLSRSIIEIAGGGVSIGLLALFVLALVVLAPVCEEIFFRGYLYPVLRNRMDKQPAMLLNGLLFAAAHFDLVGFLPRFLLGYGLCWIYERNRTLGGPIAGHALYNGLILLLFGIWQLF